jgi:hypothetical protein
MPSLAKDDLLDGGKEIALSRPACVDRFPPGYPKPKMLGYLASRATYLTSPSSSSASSVRDRSGSGAGMASYTPRLSIGSPSITRMS